MTMIESPKVRSVDLTWRNVSCQVSWSHNSRLSREHAFQKACDALIRSGYNIGKDLAFAQLLNFLYALDFDEFNQRDPKPITVKIEATSPVHGHHKYFFSLRDSSFRDTFFFARTTIRMVNDGLPNFVLAAHLEAMAQLKKAQENVRIEYGVAEEKP